MQPIEQKIEVTGSAESKRELDQLAEGMKGIGDQSEKAGKKAGKTAEKIDEAGEKTNVFGGALGKLAGSFGALTAIKALWDGIVESHREAIRLQDEFSGKAVDLAAQSKAFGAQIDVGEDEAVSILTQLREAGGFSIDTAKSLGTAAAIAFDSSGGLFGGQNFKTTREIAAFAGAKDFSPDAVSSLFAFLKTAGALESPDAAKEATAKISAAATASLADNVGAFVNELNRGGTGLLQAGVSLQDVLELAGQARQAEVSEELAAQVLVTLQQVAVATSTDEFEQEISRVAKGQDLDPTSLSSSQRVQITRDIFGGVNAQEEQDRVLALLGADQGLRLLKSLRGSNVAATSAIGQAAQDATVSDFDAIVESDRDSITRLENQNQAKIDFLGFGTGKEKFTIAAARKLAEARLQLDIARRIAVVTPRTREAEFEKKVAEVLQEKIDELRRRGAHVGLAQDELDHLGVFSPTTGFVDDEFDDVAREIDAALRSLNLGGNVPSGANRQRTRHGPPTIEEFIEEHPSRHGLPNTFPLLPFLGAIQEFIKDAVENRPRSAPITNIGVNYQDVEAGRHPPEDEDLND